MWKALLDTVPHGYTIPEQNWQRRHRLLLRLLAAHVPALALFGAFTGAGAWSLAAAAGVPAAAVAFGYALRRHRRLAAVIVTLGFVYVSTALVALSGGAIEAHFHFFIIIGFIAVYQDWATFLFMILFTTISHGVGSVWQQNLIFSHAAGQSSPWLWSLVHGVAVLFACAGIMLFWWATEDSQHEKDVLARRLAEAEISRRQFTSDLLVNLARRNQSMLYRQLDIINQLEESERDPDTLAELFTLDHLATRVRRNAESLLVLSGEQPPRTWSEPVPLRDVLRAAIAETEDLERVVFVVDERLAVVGHAITDLTHLIAELTENAVRFSPPDSVVTLRARPDRTEPGGQVITVEDWGVGMPSPDLAAANALLAEPPEVDLSVSQRLGFHVVARLAARHHVSVSLIATPGSGITAVIALPGALFAPNRAAPEPGRHLMDERGMPGRGAAGAGVVSAGAGAGSSAASHELPMPRRFDDPPAPRRGRPAAAATPTIALPLPFTAVPATAGARSPVGGDQSWLGWWEPDVEAAPGPAAVPSPRPRATAPAPPALSPPALSPPALSPPALSPPALSPPAAAAVSPAQPADAPPVDPAGGLRRRVPQTHLAPELRQPITEPEPTRPVAPGQVSDAANALSRYQASRQAARAATDGENGRAS